MSFTQMMIIRALVVTGILLLLDFYIFRGFKVITTDLANEKLKNTLTWGYWLMNGLVILAVWTGFILYFKGGREYYHFITIVFGILILFMVPKLMAGIVLLVEDVVRLLWGTGEKVVEIVKGSDDDSDFFPERRKFVSFLALGIAVVPFAAIFHGLVKGKYLFKVRRPDIRLKGLPKAFEGFRIVQISDLHVGSFQSREDVAEGVKEIMALKPDLILFTGDMVNNVAEEAEDWVDVFGMLNAPYGMFSVLGNHDYGDYEPSLDAAGRKRNVEKLAELERKMGFRMLRNESVRIEKDGESIVIAGVENWGLPPFPQKGDLDLALKDVSTDETIILLSHDPTHFDEKVVINNKKVDLTLSGHTHGMQFGVEIPGFRWSPVKYRYPRWADLYEVGGQYLYVNRGFGYIGFPGRVGIWPEITEIVLRG